MSLMLDTQALLWFLLDDPRLSEKAQASIASTDVSIFVSPASIWEIAIKISLGKYTLPAPFVTFWSEQLQTNNFLLLPIAVSHAARVVNLPFHHRDPFDRLIIMVWSEYGIERNVGFKRGDCRECGEAVGRDSNLVDTMSCLNNDATGDVVSIYALI